MKKIITKSLRDTRRVATRIAESIRGGEVCALQGELGAGKTAFAKAFGRALGVHKTITSPTFLLMRVYDVRGHVSGVRCFVHVDAYRVHDAQELMDIGLGEYLGQRDAVVLIEWAEKVKKILPKKGVQWIRFSLGTNSQERALVFSSQMR